MTPHSLRRIHRLAALGVVVAVAAGCAGTPGPGQRVQTPRLEIESAMRLSQAAAEGGDINAALLILENVVQRFPDETAPRLALADTHFAMGALPEAHAGYAALVDDSEIGVGALIGLGRLALSEDRPEAAAVQFEAALARDPGNIAALNGRAVALDLTGRHFEAQRLYDEILERDPGNRAVLTNRGLSLALGADPRRGVEALAPLASGAAALPEARHNLALAHALAGDLAAAERILRTELDATEMRETLAFYRRIGAR